MIKVFAGVMHFGELMQRLLPRIRSTNCKCTRALRQASFLFDFADF